MKSIWESCPDMKSMTTLRRRAKAGPQSIALGCPLLLCPLRSCYDELPYTVRHRAEWLPTR